MTTGDRGWERHWFEENEEALQSTLRRAGAAEVRISSLLSQLKLMLMVAMNSLSGKDTISPEGKKESWTELPIYRRDNNQLKKWVIDRLYLQPGRRDDYCRTIRVGRTRRQRD